MRLEELRVLARSVVERAPERTQVEVFASRVTDVTVKVHDSSVESLTFSESCGVGIRVVRNGRLGFCSTADVSEAGLRWALAQASENAWVAEPDDAHALPEPAGDGGAFPADADPPEPVDVHRLVAAALDLERLALGSHREIVQASPAMIGQESRQVALVSSTGIDAAWERAEAYAAVSALACRGDDAQTGLGFTYRRRFDELDLESAAAEAGTRARRLLGARPARSAFLPVVLDPLPTARFLRALAPAFSGRAVSEGTSPFARRIGELVAARCLTLVDDGRLPGGPASARFDDEGMPTSRTVLIDAGRVAGFLHNNESARRLGEPASTGNGRRTGFRSLPNVQPTNLYLEGPLTPPHDIVASVDHGVYVQDVKGLQSGYNRVAGEFSVGFSGLLIRAGELAEPVQRMTLSFNLDTLLDSVSAIGDDRRFYPLDSALGGATLLFGPVNVVGSDDRGAG